MGMRQRRNDQTLLRDFITGSMRVSSAFNCATCGRWNGC